MRCAGLFEACACVKDLSNNRNSQYTYPYPSLGQLYIIYIILVRQKNDRMPTTFGSTVPRTK